MSDAHEGAAAQTPEVDTEEQMQRRTGLGPTETVLSVALAEEGSPRLPVDSVKYGVKTSSRLER